MCGPMGRHFRMSEVPLYAIGHEATCPPPPRRQPLLEMFSAGALCMYWCAASPSPIPLGQQGTSLESLNQAPPPSPSRAVSPSRDEPCYRGTSPIKKRPPESTRHGCSIQRL